MLNLENKLKDVKEYELELFEQQLHIVQEALESITLQSQITESNNKELSRKYECLLQENILLFNQLCLVQKELVHQITLLSDISLPSPSVKEAELRVKQHLSYKLGYVLVQNGKSVLGWIKMPWLLCAVVRRYRLNKNIEKKNEYGR